MAGIYIPNMQMPISCHECPLADTLMTCPCMKMLYKDFRDSVLLKFARHEDCPLIPVPDHGDLIDRDALIMPPKDVDPHSTAEYVNNLINAWGTVFDAPTIIPASGGNRNE